MKVIHMIDNYQRTTISSVKVNLPAKQYLIRTNVESALYLDSQFVVLNINSRQNYHLPDDGCIQLRGVYAATSTVSGS